MRARTLLVCLVIFSALGLMLQAQAFRRTGVTSAASMTVTSTDAAALQLIAGTGAGNVAETAYYSAGSLYLDFTKGKNKAAGFAFEQPPAGVNLYRFRALFQVRNAKNVAKCVWVYVPGGGVSGLEAILLNGTTVASTGGAKSAGCVTIPANTTYNVDVWWSITPTTSASGSFTVRVEAE